MFDVHRKAGSANAAVWFAERDGRYQTLDEAIACAQALLEGVPDSPGEAGIRDVVILDMDDNAYDESGSPCRLPEGLADALAPSS